MHHRITAGRQSYQLAVSYRSAPHADLSAEIGHSAILISVLSSPYDAPRTQACGVILSALLGGRRLRSPDSEVRFTTIRIGLKLGLESRLFTGQQSNTSVMLGDTAILKLFRRLELGHNLDIEVHAALNAVGLEDVAELFGWVG